MAENGVENGAAPPPAATTEAKVQSFVGIDLGVLNTVVSCSRAEEPSAVTVATNDVSNRSTPACVGFDQQLRLVGDPADAKLTQLPKQTITSIPAVLGTKEAARAAYDKLGCQWKFTDDGKVGPLSFGGKEDLELSPAACLAALLQRLVSFGAGEDVQTSFAAGPAAQTFETAISVPDSWADAELAALRAAVDILGWKHDLVHVVPFSTALATAYAQRLGQKLQAEEAKRVVAFVDVGYSQSTVTVAALSPAAEGAESQDLAVEVLASVQSMNIGTQAFCAALASHVNTKAKEPVALNSKRGARLMVALQKGLKELSMLPDTTVALECFYADESDLKVDLTRACLEDMVQVQLQELKDLMAKALTDSGVTADDVHSVELIGGGMRIPKVQQLISEAFPKAAEDDDSPAAETMASKNLSAKLRFSLDGASAIATGATHYAAGRRAVAKAWKIAEQASAIASEADLAAAREQEAWMAKVNQEELHRLEKQNELESFIYEVKGWLSGPDRALLNPDVVEPFLEEHTRWFEDAQYEEGTTFAMYDERLKNLKAKLEEEGKEYYEKKRKEKEELEKKLDAAAEEERKRRQETGMDADKDDRKMAKSERMKLAQKNKEEGNVVFKAGNLDDAAARYQRALQHINKFFMLDVSPEEKEEANALCLSIQLNLAQVFLKQAQQTEKDSGKEKAEAIYKKAKAACDEALKVDENNVKAKFRKASALERLGSMEEAAKEVKAALKVEPENADLLKFKERLDKWDKAQKDKAKKTYGKMFG
eukprot:TRINITY_DN14543_c0_g1_i1.p1 TRINITY_DN14543_c0_g1~~TRINITY_DN14543_c0_g1_i1.p1  ORF type:complete len:796 (+),score=314.25 TRINITY_DN14543_c0_g1_i1:83-2389(+)